MFDRWLWKDPQQQYWVNTKAMPKGAGDEFVRYMNGLAMNGETEEYTPNEVAKAAAEEFYKLTGFHASDFFDYKNKLNNQIESHLQGPTL